MVLLNQLNEKWSKVKMLPSNLSIGRYGCLLNCLCMLSDYYGCFVAPDQAVDTKVKFTKDGLVIWQKINFDKFKFVSRLYNNDSEKIQECLIDPDKACVLQVDNCHWVVPVGKSIFGGYRIFDPWKGVKSTTRAYKAITGVATFKRI